MEIGSNRHGKGILEVKTKTNLQSNFSHWLL
jgi:hypothetical protein